MVADTVIMESDAPKSPVAATDPHITPVLRVDSDAQYAYEHQARCALVVSVIGAAIILSAICSRIDSPPLVIGLVLLFCGVLWSAFNFGYLADRAVVLTHALDVNSSAAADKPDACHALTPRDMRLRREYVLHAQSQLRDKTVATHTRAKLEFSFAVLVLMAFTCSTSWLSSFVFVVYGYFVWDYAACHAAYIVLAPVQSDGDGKTVPAS
jgi:hypothetical protein